MLIEQERLQRLFPPGAFRGEIVGVHLGAERLNAEIAEQRMSGKLIRADQRHIAKATDIVIADDGEIAHLEDDVVVLVAAAGLMRKFAEHARAVHFAAVAISTRLPTRKRPVMPRCMASIWPSSR